MKRAYADIPEGQMHYRIEGSGEPLILLHMAVGSSDEFTRAIPYTIKKISYHCPRFLGRGRLRPISARINVIDHAQTVANFMDALKIKKTNFVGHHLGSIVAAEFEIKWPERVNKMILSGIGYKPEPSEGKAFEDPPTLWARWN